MLIWTFYLLFYTLLSFFYVVYRYAFLLASNDSIGSYSGKFSVIVPYFNEEVNLLQKTIRSISEAKGDKEIIVVDDGSSNLECYNMLSNLKNEIDFQLIRYEKNMGKRYAQTIGLNKATSDIIITVDSDTTFDKNAFVELIKPFSDSKIGATTGSLNILNENTNWLTKMMSARYWNAFNFERQSQSSFCGIVCCTGPLSAYRKEIFLKVSDRYNSQEFLGKKCTYGDDRHLTALFIQEGHKVAFCKDSIGYTDSPDTLKKFLKQQTRWKKSWLRENFLMSKYIWKKDKKIAFELFLTTGIVFISIPLRIMFLVSILMNPSYFLEILPMFCAIILMQNSYMIVNKPKYLLMMFLYSLFYVFVLYWLLFYALATINDTRWGTR